MTWQTITQGLTAIYLIGGSLMMTTHDLQSAFVFKVIPMALGFLLAVGTAGQILGWPL